MTDLLARAHLVSDLLDCRACPLADTPHRAVPFSAPPDYDGRIACIGEAPGRQEVDQGQPFIGHAGRELRAQLREVGIDPSRVAYLNAVSHWPTPRPKMTPLLEDVAACRAWVDRQLAHLRPRYLLVLGGVALSSFWPKLRVTEARGHWWEAWWKGDDDGGVRRPSTVPDVPHAGTGRSSVVGGRCWAFTVLHPAAVLPGRAPSLRAGVLDELAEFAHYALRDDAPAETPWCCICFKAGKGRVPYRTIRGLSFCRSHVRVPRGEELTLV